jgi:hypothetical protein
MLRIEDSGVANLEISEAASVRGGDGGIVELILGVATAVGAGFLWGYKNLGPIFNRYF